MRGGTARETEELMRRTTTEPKKRQQNSIEKTRRRKRRKPQPKAQSSGWPPGIAQIWWVLYLYAALSGRAPIPEGPKPPPPVIVT